MKSLDNRRHSLGGFTLVELIVVIAIVGVLTAMLTPVMRGFVREASESARIMEARIIVTAVQTAIVEEAGLYNEELLINKTYGDVKCGAVTNFMMSRAQNEDRDFKLGRNKVDYDIACKVLENLDSRSKSANFYKFDGKEQNPWGMYLAEFEKKYPGVPALAIVYDVDGNILLMEYGRGGVMVRYKDGEYTIVEDKYPKFSEVKY